MDAKQKIIAENSTIGAYEGTSDFPTTLSTLANAGFEGYLVDYRKGTTTYYLPDGDNVEVKNVKTAGVVAPTFNASVVEANVRKSQANAHTYRDFCEGVKNAGCAGYLVTLLGRRVVYFGRTGETHVEFFPS
jgi:uncharacterized protein YbcV (DUF1398 family)